MTSASDTAPIGGLSARERLIRLLAVGEVGVIGALIIVALFFYALEPAFLSERNIRAILTVVSFVGIIAIGQTILLVNGEFDLSVGSVAGLCAVSSATLMATLPVPLAVLGGAALGAFVGLVNGVMVVRLKIPAFIQTLGMLFIGQGLIQLVTGGYPVYPLPPAVGAVGLARPLLGLGFSFFVFIVIAIAADFMLRRTVLGRNMYATGGNPEVARLVGINTDCYKIASFVLIGLLAAIAGMFVMADLSSGTTSIGTGWELTVIAGVVVGGVSLFGGAGTMAGGLVGVLLLQVVQSGLVVIGVNANWQQIAVGTIMVLAVGLDILRRRFFIEGGSREETGPADAVSQLDGPGV